MEKPKKIVKVDGQYLEFLEIVPIPVDGELHYFGFRVNGFVAPYTDYKNKPIDLRDFAQHDLAKYETWRKASAENRDAIEPQFKLAPIVAPMVMTGAKASTLFMELTREQYEEVTNAKSKAELIDQLEEAEAKAKALADKENASSQALAEAEARIAELEKQLQPKNDSKK